MLRSGVSSSLLSPTKVEKEGLLESPGFNEISSTTPGKKVDVKKPIPFILAGYDLSWCNESVRFAILTGMLFVFTCGYSYYQEMVIYSWFRRKLGVFTTMMYFVGTSLCCIVEKYIMSGNQPLRRKAPWSYHLAISALKLVSQMLTNVSMQHINYPAKVLFKGAIPIAQLGIGVLWLRKGYPSRDYVACCLLLIGLYIFLTSNNKQPDANAYGIVMVTLAMVGAAAVPMVQEHCMNNYGSSPTEMLYFSFMGGAFLSIVITILCGEFHDGVSFLFTGNETYLNIDPEKVRNSAVYAAAEEPWVAYVGFICFGYYGARCSAAITQHFGALVNGITNTARKAASIAFSFIMFPASHPFTFQHFIGSLVFFSGLMIRTFAKVRESKSQDKDCGSSDGISIGIGRSGSSSNINSSLGGSGSSGTLCDTIPDAPLGPVDSQKPSKYYVSEFKDRDDKQVV